MLTVLSEGKGISANGLAIKTHLILRGRAAGILNGADGVRQALICPRATRHLFSLHLSFTEIGKALDYASVGVGQESDLMGMAAPGRSQTFGARPCGRPKWQDKHQALCEPFPMESCLTCGLPSMIQAQSGANAGVVLSHTPGDDFPGPASFTTPFADQRESAVSALHPASIPRAPGRQVVVSGRQNLRQENPPASSSSLAS